ncbi:putative DMT superfamily transporter inner membrane protein [Pseudovibrio axinellae]|uniref:Putative DMT superfamily transporter inner membrane protein n=1 Tax=Pseudovibrio axinellae TaxID=989403 RepID=A0A165U143_9HYPH|nr:DMT family transporter [Pseudovibrio axinellae]KZL09414.1 putative DMT superfamily transporter inner membrane protein [Pseudovibrio axinellae]SEQ65662.1 EamA-like transporter family protein [Pseudovibrio axinellae]
MQVSVAQRSSAGWGSGLLGVLIFSGSLPATRVGVAGFDPFFLTSVRAVIAALLAMAFLSFLKQPLPKRHDILSLAVVALGVVVGFPLLSALALQQMSAAHSLVLSGLLPLSTAIFAVFRAGEKPKLLFWVCSGLGSLAVVIYALLHSSGGPTQGDLYMLVAVVVCGLAYAEGATLSKKLGGWQVISWALVLAFPVMLLVALVSWPVELPDIHSTAWIGLAYISVFSMLIGFVFWYRGLALGGVAAVSQLQLLQPFFGLMLAAVLLQEQISPAMIGATLFVVACVVGAKRNA